MSEFKNQSIEYIIVKEPNVVQGSKCESVFFLL